MIITEIDLTKQLTNAAVVFSLVLIAFSLAILAFGKLEKQVKVDKKRKTK